MSNDPPLQKPIPKYHSYPKPEAEYQEIIQNPDRFLQKLHSFHVFYGTKFRYSSFLLLYSFSFFWFSFFFF